MIAPMEPDWRVAGFLMLAACAAAVLFGLVPALHTSNTSLTRASRGEFGENLTVSRLRSTLVVAQVAVCALFLVTAFTVLGGLRQLASTDTGLELDRVADVRIPAEHRDAMIARLRADTRIEQIGVAWRGPLYGPLRTTLVTPSGSSEAVPTGTTVVSPEYFELLRLPLLGGRVFTPEEAIARADVGVISEATARRFWPGRDALGQFITINDASRVVQGARTFPHKRVQVIGIAKDAINGMLMDGIDATCIYLPISVDREDEAMLLVRARSSQGELRQAVSDATATIRKDASFSVYPLAAIIGVQIWSLQALSWVVTLLAAIALVLAVSGTYGVIAYLVMQRTREFGIRVALGATAGGIVRSVVRGALRLGLIGIVIGLALALAEFVAFTAVVDLDAQLEVLPFAGGAVVVLLAMMFAAWLPSLGAARVDPAVALRSE
jgi:hypothetical protein